MTNEEWKDSLSHIERRHLEKAESISTDQTTPGWGWAKSCVVLYRLLGAARNDAMFNGAWRQAAEEERDIALRRLENIKLMASNWQKEADYMSNYAEGADTRNPSAMRRIAMRLARCAREVFDTLDDYRVTGEVRGSRSMDALREKHE